jgi:hypothetical protein
MKNCRCTLWSILVKFEGGVHLDGQTVGEKTRRSLRASVHINRVKLKKQTQTCLTIILLMWRIRWANIIPIHIQQDATLHSLFIFGNCSTYFRWYFHPSSGAHIPVSTASGICHTVTAICRCRGRVGTGLSVLWVAYLCNILTMHVHINVKSPNNISKWQVGFNSAFKGLRASYFTLHIEYVACVCLCVCVYIYIYMRLSKCQKVHYLPLTYAYYMGVRLLSTV